MEGWIDLLKRLCETPGVSGYEDKVIEAVKEGLSPSTDRVEVDHMGNVFGLKEGSSKRAPKVMVTAHMDEVGLVVKHVDDKGFVRFDRLGGVPEKVLPGQRVVIHGRAGPVYGVIGTKPGHVITEQERYTVPPVRDSYIDVGADSRGEAETFGVRVGDMITFDRSFRSLKNRRVTAKALDNRVGVTVMIEVMRRLEGTGHEPTIWAVGTVQEEVGWRGAKVATHRVKPDLAIVLDGLHAGGTPDIARHELPLDLGRGPAITVVDSTRTGLGGIISNPILRGILTTTAEEGGIPYQLNVNPFAGVSDAAAVHLVGEGVPTCDVLVIRRYSHTPIEVVSLDDVENAIRLVVAAVQRIGPGFSAARV